MSYRESLLFFMDKKVRLVVDKEYILGRSEDCHIVLDEPTVSRKHAKIWFSEGFFHIQDLQSTNGTRLNGKAIKSAGLKSRDHITIGLFHLIFLERDEASHKQMDYEAMLRDTLALEYKMARILEEVKSHDLKEKIFELKKVINTSRDKMNRLANVDRLTGLFNRRFFDETIILEIERALRYNSALSLVIMDIDHFKSFNDTHGHQKGDEVLAVTAGILQENIRVNDIACRYGGEEFIVILPGTISEGASVLAEKIRFTLEEESQGRTGLKITASFGVSTFNLQGDSPEDFIQRADQGLYAAKKNGRNRVEKGSAKLPQPPDQSKD
jgi:diguanylate cyclase (GGDEF)-like protein